MRTLRVLVAEDDEDQTAGLELSDHLGRMAEYWVHRSELPNVATTDAC